MDIPNHLSHKPIIKLEKYSFIDGEYAGKTDTEGLSIGLAMWSEDESPALSAKVWRHTGDKWSRQSEELPLHRVIDLACLICASKLFAETETIPVDTDNEFNITIANNQKLIDTLKKVLESDKDHKYNLDLSLKRLSDYLKKIGY
ncbi:DUF6530 family protein [Xenorhabdus koppenhoeferi]|uniref:Uncharacterized protein n=1 Tax=Xenorhabdus koppenhoeferi TaxID=351659 RepID=A0A1I7K334_9GAMM|nr:DUF6530 family protein [Xenorhabdus koppenhoeferi]SFU91785.1 hypothetical protein SAMN05421784_1458 [Xenorhabdus koppenhoeferi]